MTEPTNANRPRYVDHPELHAPDAEARFFPAGRPLPRLPAVVHLDPDASMFDTIKADPLSRAEERAAFLAYNYARLRAADPDAADAGQWAGRAAHWREYLVRVNVGLVGFAYGRRRARLSHVDEDTAYSDGLQALLRAVDGFDVAFGIKFSTYTIRSVYNALNCKSIRGSQRAMRMPTVELNDGVERHGVPVDPNAEHEAQAEESAERVSLVRRALDDNAAGLTENERFVVRNRFREGRPLTLERCAQHLGLSKERVRQLQTIALRKLRPVLASALAA